MELLYKRCAGLDVHAETIVACVLLGESETDMEKEIETFPTLTKDLFRLLKWLEGKTGYPYCDGKHRDLLETCLQYFRRFL